MMGSPGGTEVLAVSSAYRTVRFILTVTANEKRAGNRRGKGTAVYREGLGG